MSVNHAPGQTSADPLAGGPANQPDLNDLRSDVDGIANLAAERGRGFVDAAKSQAVNYVDRRRGDAAQSVHDLAQGLRHSSKSFDDKPNIKAFFDSAADGLEQLGGSIENRSFSEIYDDAEAFARKAPVAVAVATFVTGFVVARFIKSSSVSQAGSRHDGHRT